MQRILAVLIILVAGNAYAAWPETCRELSASNQERAKEVMKLVYPHDCCDDNLLKCSEASAPSRLVVRLASAVCSRVKLGEDSKAIVREMEKRGSSMMAKKATIDHNAMTWAGDSSAPVAVVAYACARCPFCSKSLPEMYEAVTKGTLKGKAKLAYRNFPIKGHDFSKEGGFAFEAAHAMGKFWPYLLLVYSRFDAFCPKKLAQWATEVGLDQGLFQSTMESKATREAVVESKREGLRNKVESTPTYFINGKLYQADSKTWALTGAVLEEYERVTGVLCKP